MTQITLPVWCASRLQSADRGRVDGVGPRYVDQCFAISEPLQRFLTLVQVQLWRLAKTHPTGLGALPASIGAAP